MSGFQWYVVELRFAAVDAERVARHLTRHCRSVDAIAVHHGNLAFASQSGQRAFRRTLEQCCRAYDGIDRGLVVTGNDTGDVAFGSLYRYEDGELHEVTRRATSMHGRDGEKYLTGQFLVQEPAFASGDGSSTLSTDYRQRLVEYFAAEYGFYAPTLDELRDATPCRYFDPAPDPDSPPGRFAVVLDGTAFADADVGDVGVPGLTVHSLEHLASATRVVLTAAPSLTLRQVATALVRRARERSSDGRATAADPWDDVWRIAAPSTARRPERPGESETANDRIDLRYDVELRAGRDLDVGDVSLDPALHYPDHRRYSVVDVTVEDDAVTWTVSPRRLVSPWLLGWHFAAGNARTVAGTATPLDPATRVRVADPDT